MRLTRGEMPEQNNIWWLYGLEEKVIVRRWKNELALLSS
jgi:hypothetical protein